MLEDDLPDNSRQRHLTEPSPTMKKILIVEDHADIRRLIRMTLEFEDCEILEAGTPSRLATGAALQARSGAARRDDARQPERPGSVPALKARPMPAARRG
jgi:hypothetical protein